MGYVAILLTLAIGGAIVYTQFGRDPVTAVVENRSPTLEHQHAIEVANQLVDSINRKQQGDVSNSNKQNLMWKDYVKPSPEVLKHELSPIEYEVTQGNGTERAGTSLLDKNYEPGIYVDILSGEPLFSSKDKFDSGTGWPSFSKPITPEAVTEYEDNKFFFMKRTEVRSAIADNHLGHVFPDGPADSGGMRYCMNGVALRFVPKAEMEAEGYSEYRVHVD